MTGAAIKTVKVKKKRELQHLPGCTEHTCVPQCPAAKGEPLDDYPTKPPYAREMVRRVADVWYQHHYDDLGLPDGGPGPAVIVEPSAGAGTFVRACREQFPNAFMIANEIQPQYHGSLGEAGAMWIGNLDAREAVTILSQTRPDAGSWLFIGNPPYAPSQSHIEAILDVMQPGDMLAFLLRVNYLGGQDRVRTLFEARKTNRLRWVIPFAQRPGFKVNKDGEKGTDMTEYACFIWLGGYEGQNWEGLPHLWVSDEERRVA